uniref:Uncharacterized protein NKAPD1 isoform X1 n=1 Tax=Geotrypetes seraphini TaxID=260995 RepID=A0A6P8PFS4_GEOSA|nr:uncharacterized protein NKAPD1 isoform X1 [Geotrypetes seraphini]XP_033774472.1 uncharacterized protein NKAPD1 isoform X1 [Geotrypetes seraphini]XP_033774473.1 uncharacterized protein NKAPD1 isoform X1 [Geotrypetes seraphini]
MSRVPLGKVLLRNVIRHTDAHNKIQEESEMWKIRELEKQTEETYSTKRRAASPDVARWDHSGYRELYPEEFNTGKSRMRSDGFDDEGGGHREDSRVKTVGQTVVTLEKDLRKTQYWNKRIYECEASIPDRWGHSGYKELYPEEFETDSDGEKRDEKCALNGKEKSMPVKRTTQESRKRKRPKKSHKKKQRKRSHKKLKKKRKEEQSESSSDGESLAESAGKARKMRQKRRKTRKKASKQPSPSSGAESDSPDTVKISSSSGEGKPQEKKTWTKRRKKKRHHSQPRIDLETQEKKSKRKNWKVANDDRSEESSDED